MKTRQVRLGLTDFHFILPGTWAAIPMADAESMKKRVAALVKEQMGRDDRLASRRLQMRNELIEVAGKAAEQGAVSFALALELLPGVPFGAALMARFQPWSDSGDGDVATRLAATFPHADIIALDGGGVAARVAAAGSQKYVTEETPSLFVEYWTPAPHSDDLLYITVSAPMAPQADLFTQLFDAVIGSLTWDVDVAKEILESEFVENAG
ncbi:hypothetical protein L1277_000049 [Okibacterium sp. HSC-33S16]|uniref:hypothetical protein n=1 Tax=Okibacterium sp. HSC-33S16 TaxID=2910965 RepID=UPI0020A190D9|nr:hypothetical protein [Okibacterium sp. HSC-33S16]MCP2029985.1 hypothetical protein [Okibacterium sp. HSC-33S16]